MFNINLKALLQLSKSTESRLVQRKRIACGKFSYMLSYSLLDGVLTIRRVKRFQRRLHSKSKRRRTHYHHEHHDQLPSLCQSENKSLTDKSSQTFIIVKGLPEPPMAASTQTPKIQYANHSVDTWGLSLMVTRQQQTEKQLLNSSSCQTKQLKTEERSIQSELKQRHRFTQSEVSPVQNGDKSSQTKHRTIMHNSTQTKSVSEEQLNPYDNVFGVLLRSVSHHCDLLIRIMESTNQILEFKELELKRSDLQKKHMQQKMQRRQRKRLRMRVKAVPKAEQRRQGEAQTQTNHERADLSTQTEPTTERSLPLAVAATQTDRLKGLAWLRYSNLN